jgi:Rod binding domain-containing protein
VSGLPLTPADAVALAADQRLAAAGSTRPGAGVTPEQAAQDFEAIFLTQLLKGLRRTVPGQEERSYGAQMYQELLDEQLALYLARHGGLGLAALVRAQIQPAPAGPGQRP